MIKNIILIGNGSHAKKRIIPSLKRKKINLKKIYTRKHSIFNKSKSDFLKKKNFFYVCTPPNTHYKIVKYLLENKQNVIVEKPAILKLNHLNNIKKKISKNNKNIFIENLMYKYSKIYSKFLDYWSKNKKKTLKLEINFLIPNFFDIGFRSRQQDSFIVLHDIGIYPISLLNNMNIEILKIEILAKEYLKKKIKKLRLKIISKNLIIYINIGEQLKYMNNLIISHNDGSKIIFEKIFSGIKLNKSITKINKINKTIRKLIIKDHNCFDKFFSLKFSNYKTLNKNNIILMEKNIDFFDKIKLKIKSN